MKEEFSELKILSKDVLAPEAGRACYFYSAYLIINAYSREFKEWPFNTDAAVSSKNNNCKFFYFIDEKEKFVNLAKNYVKNIS